MQNKKKVIRFNFDEYFKNKKVRDTSTFIYRPNEAFYELNGQAIPVKQFEQSYPLTVRRSVKSLDGRHIQ